MAELTKELNKMLKIKTRLLMVFHPQTDRYFQKKTEYATKSDIEGLNKGITSFSQLCHSEYRLILRLFMYIQKFLLTKFASQRYSRIKIKCLQKSLVHP